MDTTTALLASIGIDIGKEVFHIVGFGTNGNADGGGSKCIVSAVAQTQTCQHRRSGPQPDSSTATTPRHSITSSARASNYVPALGGMKGDGAR
jgi:hypothetical protein